LSALLSAPFYPFTVAGGVVVGLLAIELLTMVLGMSAASLLDHSVGFDGHVHTHDAGPLAGAISWLNVGRVPLLVLIILATAAFAVVGYTIQSVAAAVAAPLPASIASLLALGAAVPTTRAGSRTLAKLIPHDETYAVELSQLIGRVGRVALGPLDSGHPGRVHVYDQHSNLHVVRARPVPDHDPIPQGAEVLIIEDKGGVFDVMTAPLDLRSPA
jgi:membrane protein implicated in regulation of membrane protease activity